MKKKMDVKDEKCIIFMVNDSSPACNAFCSKCFVYIYVSTYRGIHSVLTYKVFLRKHCNMYSGTP